MSDHELKTLIAGHIAHRAELDALSDQIQALGRKLGVIDLDGLSLKAWIDKRRGVYMRLYADEMESADPALAAAILEKIDSARRKIGLGDLHSEE